MIALGAVVMGTALPSLQFSRPGLFAALLVLSVISSALKVDMPLGVGSSCISLSYAVDFTALLLLGPAPTMLIAITSAWSQCTFRMKERNPAYKTLFSMATSGGERGCRRCARTPRLAAHTARCRRRRCSR